MSKIHLAFKKLVPHASLPTHARYGDVGLDIRACERGLIRPGETKKVPTGLALANDPYGYHLSQAHPLYKIYDKYFLKIEGRSGLASAGIFPVGGIIDPAYRGEITPIIYNSSRYTFYYNDQDRIAQLVLYPAINVSTSGLSISEEEEVEDSPRGTDGFGSTGK